MDNNTYSIEVVLYREHDDATFIGRGSPLGNPFPMKVEEERDWVCDAYRDYFDEKLSVGDEEILDELARLVEITIEQGYIKLGCFCNSRTRPRRCHGDTVKAFLESVIN